MLSKRSIFILLLILLFTSPKLISGQTEETSVKIEKVDATPQLIEGTKSVTELEIDGITKYEIPTLFTGPNYYHILNVGITDNIDSLFTDEWYKFEIGIDLDQTIFDPEDLVFTLEDKHNFSTYIANDVDRNMHMVFDPSIISLSNKSVTAELFIEVQTYMVPSHQYDFSSTTYKIMTNTIDTKFFADGTYTWVPLATTFIFLDYNLLELNSLDPGYEIHLKLQIGNVISSQLSDRVRISVAGFAVSERVQPELMMDFVVNYSPVLVVDIYTLSDQLSFDFQQVQFTIDLTDQSQVEQIINIPFYSFFIAILLNMISYFVVKKMVEGDQHWRGEN